MEIIGIIVFCGGIICAAAWLLNRPERPKDPEEDREQRGADYGAETGRSKLPVSKSRSAGAQP